MHDILEGSLQLCTKLLLNQFIVDKKLFSLAVLNQRITSYKYGPAITEKPSSISRTTLNSNDGKLHQSGIILQFCTLQYYLLQSENAYSVSASQMWYLGRFLPLLIGDFIPEDDDYWENFLTLLDIIDYVFAPVTTHRLASHISLLVEDFLTEFSKLYGRPLTPKMHYLVHIPSWIIK